MKSIKYSQINNIFKSLNSNITMISKELLSVVTKFRKYLVSTFRYIKSLPLQISHIPKTIRQWRITDAKKKKYRSFRLQRRLKPELLFIPSGLTLLKQTIALIWKNKKLFLGIIGVYILVYFILIRAPFMTDAKTIVSTVREVLGESTANSLRGNVATLSAVLGTSSTGENAILTSIATLLMSLVYIWSVRQIASGKKIRVRDAYFQSMTPLLSFICVLLVISIQLVPLGVSSFVYSTARGNNLFISGVEDLTFFIVTLLLGLLSLYWITTSVMALYVATLPGIYPLSALTIARKITKFKKFTVFKRIISMALVVGVFYIALLMFIIRFAPNAVLFVTEGFKIAILPFVHVYLYKLYRSLI